MPPLFGSFGDRCYSRDLLCCFFWDLLCRLSPDLSAPPLSGSVGAASLGFCRRRLSQGSVAAPLLSVQLRPSVAARPPRRGGVACCRRVRAFLCRGPQCDLFYNELKLEQTLGPAAADMQTSSPAKQADGRRRDTARGKINNMGCVTKVGHVLLLLYCLSLKQGVGKFQTQNRLRTVLPKFVLNAPDSLTVCSKRFKRNLCK